MSTARHKVPVIVRETWERLIWCEVDAGRDSEHAAEALTEEDDAGGMRGWEHMPSPTFDAMRAGVRFHGREYTPTDTLSTPPTVADWADDTPSDTKDEA